MDITSTPIHTVAAFELVEGNVLADGRLVTAVHQFPERREGFLGRRVVPGRVFVTTLDDELGGASQILDFDQRVKLSTKAIVSGARS